VPSASGSPVTATSSGNVVTITSNGTGAAADYPYSVTNGDFSGTDSGATLTGGASGGTVYDSGTISVSVNGGTTVSTSWQSGSSISSLASALQAALANPANGYSTLLSATPTSTGVTLTSLQPGTTGNLSISCTATHTSSQFSTASFATSCAGMSGGANAQYAPVTAYSYSIANSTGVPGSGFAANGNVNNVTDSVIGTWSYNYDNLNRLTGATGQSGSYGSQAIAGVNLGWSYDSFGNRFGQTSTSNNFPTSWACFVGSNNPWSACSGISGTANNRMFSSNQDSAIGYDNAGDVTNDGVNSYLYDVEGKVCGVGNSQSGFTQYLYDADGNRVAKGPVTAPLSCTVPSNFSPSYVYLLGMGGEQVTELVNGAWNYSNIYASGSLLATYRGTDTYFALKDWLGTKRVEVTPDGLTSSFTSLPFGDDLSPPMGNAIDANEQHFTGKERDTESGLDYFGARYYGSSMGRFMSPDWSAKAEPVPYAKLGDPQSLNLYSYMLNNPLGGVDQDGHEIVQLGRVHTMA
jgi:RHS repeat-associated protein